MPYERMDSQRTASEAERRDRERRDLGADTTATPRQRWWLRWGLAAVALLLVVGGTLVVTADPGTVPEARPFDRVEVAGDTLIVHWTGPACESHNTERTELVESSDRVQVTLFVDVPIDSCPGGGITHTAEVVLSEPAAATDVRDGACLYPGYFNDTRCHDEPVGLD